MSNVTIISPFRDAPYINRYIDQVSSLDFPPNQLRFIAIEGDSVDSTYEQLLNWKSKDDRVSVLKFDTNEPRYPSVIDHKRFAHLAKVFNSGWDLVDLEWSTHTLFLPSDVLYNSELLKNLLEKEKDIIAPMFWHPTGNGLVFYDVWGFEKDFQRFRPYTPEWYLKTYGKEPIEMDFIGGANLSVIDVIKAGIRYTDNDVDHGFCRLAKEKGFEVWADPTSHIVHEVKNGA